MKPNPISLMTFVFHADLEAGRLAYGTLLDGLKATGFDGVEIFQQELAGPRQADIRRGLAASGLKLACLDIICDLVSRDEAARRKGRDTIRAGIDLAREFGCDQAMVVGSVPKPGIEPGEARRMIADGIASQADYARRAGVVLTIEEFGMTPDLQCRATDCLEILAGAGAGVRFAFDTGNFIFCGEDPAAVLPRFLTLIHHVHIKSWRRREDRRPGDTGEYRGFIGCPVAEGVIPNRDLVRRILASGYRRWLSLECAVLGDPLAAAARDLAAVQGWLPAASR